MPLHDDQDVQLDLLKGEIPVDEMPEPIGSFIQVGDREWHELDAAGKYVRTHHTTKKPKHTRCTQDDTCRAEADEHEPGCPVEERLREELGF